MRKKSNKYSLIVAITLVSLSLIGAGISLGVLITSKSNIGYPLVYSSNNTENIEIVYENLSDVEIEYSKNLINSIEKDYLLKVEKIVFTKTLPYCSDCYGLNYPIRKTIYVNWNYNRNDVETGLCHEILHFFIPVPSSKDYSNVEHRIIRDASEKGVCYK